MSNLTTPCCDALTISSQEVARSVHVEHLVGRTPGIIVGAHPHRTDRYYILWEGDHSGTISSHSEVNNPTLTDGACG